MQKNNVDPDYDYENCILKNKLGILDKERLKQAESDIVITRIAEVFSNIHFEPTSNYFKELHKFLFKDVYDFAGNYRSIHIEKNERVLQGLSVDYTEPEKIDAEVEKVFEIIRTTDFRSLDSDEKVYYITDVLVSLWKAHPFREGNTRTCLVFLRTLLYSYGIDFSSSLFKHEGTYKYTRDALVAASFSAEDLGVKPNFTYINRLINDIIEKNTKMNL